MMRFLMKRRIDLFLVTHNQMKEKLENQGFRNFKILPHFYKQDNKLKNEKFQISKNNTLLFIAELTKEKGCNTLLKAFFKVSKILPNIKLIIIGDGPERINLINQAKKLNIIRKISFTGNVKREKLINFYKSTNILIVPSIWMENSGLVIIEAMSFGIPIIACNVGGIPSLIQDGINGYLFKPGDKHDLALKLDKILDNAGNAIKMGERSLEMVEQHQVEKSYDMFERIYTQIIARK